MGKAERKEDERMKTKGTVGIWARRAFPSSCKLPTVLLSHPSAELRAQKSRAAVGSQLVPFRSNPQREPASLLARSLYFRYPSMKDVSSSLENTNPPWCTSHDAPLRVVVNLMKVPSSPTIWLGKSCWHITMDVPPCMRSDIVFVARRILITIYCLKS